MAIQPMSAVIAAAAPILYAGAMSCGVGYTSRRSGGPEWCGSRAIASPSVKSGISVFSVLAGWVILGRRSFPEERALWMRTGIRSGAAGAEYRQKKLFPCRK
ncbi:MAG: hypothetical protein ACLUD2_16225 [Clostridium sp.]